MFEGRKTAAQRSYSRQSKYDLASRYLFISRDSRRASSGSEFEARTIGTGGGNCSTSCMGESGSVSESGVRSPVDGSEVASSAALLRSFLA